MEKQYPDNINFALVLKIIEQEFGNGAVWQFMDKWEEEEKNDE